MICVMRLVSSWSILSVRLGRLSSIRFCRKSVGLRMLSGRFWSFVGWMVVC